MKSYLPTTETVTGASYLQDTLSFIQMTRYIFFIFFVISTIFVGKGVDAYNPLLLFQTSGQAYPYILPITAVNIFFFFYALLFVLIGYVNVSGYKLSGAEKKKIIGLRLRICRLFMLICPMILIARELYFNQTWTLILFPFCSFLILTITPGNEYEIKT